MSSLGNFQGLVPIVCGIYCLLLALGVLPRNPKDPDRMALWRRKFGGMVKVLSPIVILFGIAQLFGMFK
jgi:hypothetical protein